MKSQYVIFFLLILFTQVYSGEIKFVFEFFRNGVHSPIVLDDNYEDILREKWFSSNELTAVGIKQQFSLGAVLRNHYILKNKFLDKKFNSNQIKCQSLDMSPNILTAYSQLMGMYPSPSGERVKPISLKEIIPNYDYHEIEKLVRTMRYEALPWMSAVFPVVTFPPENNYFGLTSEEVCTGVGKQLQENIQKKNVTSFTKRFNDKYAEKLSLVINNSTDFNNYNNVDLICDAVVSGHHDNRKFSALEPAINAGLNITELRKDCHKFKYIKLYEVLLGDEEQKVVRVSSSKIITKLIETYDSIIDAERNKTNIPLKMMMYSGHIKDIGSFLAYLHLALDTEIFYPKSGTTIILELVKNSKAKKIPDEEDFAINIYKNAIVLKSIRYKEFKKLVLAKRISEKIVNDFCGFTDNSYLIFIAVALVLLSVFVGFGLWIIILFQKMKSNEQKEAPVTKDDDENKIRKELINNENVNEN